MQRVLSLVLSLAIVFALIAAVPVTASAADTPSKSLSFYGAQLTISDNIAVNYYVDSKLFTETGYTNPYVVFEFNGSQTTVTSYRVGSGYYIFDFKDIAPNKMKDNIKATLYATYDGTVYSAVKDQFSIAQYCYGMLSISTGEKYAELRTLLVDLLHYGAASQVYTTYKTNDLADAELTAAQIAMGTQKAPSVTDMLDTEYSAISNPTVAWYGAGLVLKDAVVVRLVINAASVNDLCAKIVSDSDGEWTINGSDFKSVGGGYYYIDFNGLDASQMRENIYITIYNGDTIVSNTLRYSIETYVYRTENDANASVALKNLVVAMMKYGDAAYDYITEDEVPKEENPDDEGWSDWWTPEY